MARRETIHPTEAELHGPADLDQPPTGVDRKIDTLRLTTGPDLNPHVRFKLAHPVGLWSARIETEQGVPVAQFYACNGKAHQVAQRVVDLLNEHGVVPSDWRVCLAPKGQ